MQTPEEYRKKPIFETDFSRSLSQLIEDARNQFVKTRGLLSDLQRGYPGYADDLNDVKGLINCGLGRLYSINEEVVKHEIARMDKERGQSIQFRCRGIGTDSVPCCFVCGAQKPDEQFRNTVHVMMTNVAAFVDSKQNGELAVKWFSGRARLDWREHEPNWIQVKVGACTAHVKALEALAEQCGKQHGRLREMDIAELLNKH